LIRPSQVTTKDAAIFCGIQASGKTTFYRHTFFRSHLRISLDVLKTRRREGAIVRACIEVGQPFVVDNTNPTRADRRRYLEAVSTGDFVTRAFFFELSPRDAIGRSLKRPEGERIQPYAIYGTFRRLETPSLEEGFHEVMRVTPGPNGGFVVESLGAR
jgi:predicted kinase